MNTYVSIVLIIIHKPLQLHFMIDFNSNNETRVSCKQQHQEEEENANSTNMIDMVFKIKHKISQMYNEMINFILHRLISLYFW